MARTPRPRRTPLALAALLLTALGAGGCMHAQKYDEHPISFPVEGTVPRELMKVSLPEYVIEPPDVLRIEALIRPPKTQSKAGGAKKDAGARPDDDLETVLDPKTGLPVPGDVTRGLPLQPVFGDYPVRPDGRINLGIYGSVPVAGLTLTQASDAIRQVLQREANKENGGLKPETLLLVLDVSQYNSKRYYVIFDGGGQGEQVFPLPVTGNETVFDAIAQVQGLPAIASKRNIWVARRTPNPNQPEQILPVDWVGITQHAITTTNYQVMPGDRIYVKAQRLVTIDNTLARVIAPIDRLFGVTLLGTSTVNQVSGRGINGTGIR